MAFGSTNKWTPPRKSGGIPCVSTIFNLNVENEQADAGQDGRTRLARPNSQARTGTGKSSFSLFKDWQPYPVDPYSAIFDGHVYIHDSAESVE